MIQDNYGLTNDQIGRCCPSVVAEAAHESRSNHYLYIPTIAVIETLREFGYIPTAAMQSKSLVAGQQAFTKHLLRLRKANHLGNREEDVPEIVLVNSHNGTSAYSIMAGIFRLVCSNGLIVGDVNTTLRVKHIGNIINEVLEATRTIAEEAEQTMRVVEEMKHIKLTWQDKVLLAKYALKARFGDEQPRVIEGELVQPSSIHSPAAALQIRRREDRGDDLYTTLNVMQENLLTRGVRDNHGRRSRAVHGIDQTLGVNRLLWQFAQELRGQLTS